MKVAVVAHAGKMLGDGLLAFRRALEDAGVTDPLWYEVPKSRKAPKQVQRALDEGAELVIAWGGDGTVQRCIDVAGRHRRPARDRSRPGPRTCSPPTSDPEGPRAGGGDRARRHAPDARRRRRSTASTSP